jgi:hypothetical protein
MKVLSAVFALLVNLSSAQAGGNTYSCQAGTIDLGRQATVSSAELVTSRPGSVTLPVDEAGTEFRCSSAAANEALSNELTCHFDDLDSNPRAALVLPVVSTSSSSPKLSWIVPNRQNEMKGYFLTCTAKR